MGNEGKIYLLTLEKKAIALESQELQEVQKELAEYGVELIPKAYHRFGIRAVFNWVIYLLGLRSFCREKKIDVIHAFATPIGSAAYLLSRMTGIPFVVDSYEPHAESMVENGSWRKNSLVYRLLLYFEKKQTRHALTTLSASDAMPEYAEYRYGVRPAHNLYKPAGVDLGVFKLEKASEELRSELGLKGTVCVYAGKFGGIYLDREVFRFFRACYDEWEGDFTALLLTESDKDWINELARVEDFPLEALKVLKVEHREVPAYLQVADFAINPVKPVPSKRYCTSIKDGEYWACGLPVVIPPGISNDSEIIGKEEIGVIWNDQEKKGCRDAAQGIRKLIARNKKSDLQRRIREIALRERDFNHYEKHYEELYGKAGLAREGKPVFIVLIYNSFADPLFQNLMYQYILTQAERHPNYRFELLTFDMRKYALAPAEKHSTQIELSEEGIYWHPMPYHSGRFLLFKKVYDFIAALRRVILIRIQQKPKMTLSFANNAAAITIILSKLLRTKHMVYGYEPHSEFMAEFGIWKRSSFRYKVLKYLEDLTDRSSDYIVTGTDHLKQKLEGVNGQAKVYRAPCSVDENIFQFYPKDREKIRSEQGWTNRKVLIYVGKFGGVYYDEEIPEFVMALKLEIPELFFLVLSPNDHQLLEKKFARSGWKEEDYLITEAKGAQAVAAWNSAADFAITAIPPLPSQRFRSPVKVGEYLMCGLPFITCAGISEDDKCAKENDVGVVIREMVVAEAPAAARAMIKYWSEDPDELRSRCRSAGITYRSKRNVDVVFEEILAEVVADSTSKSTS